MICFYSLVYVPYVIVFRVSSHKLKPISSFIDYLEDYLMFAINMPNLGTGTDGLASMKSPLKATICRLALHLRR
jgi:hypothetical protein